MMLFDRDQGQWSTRTYVMDGRTRVSYPYPDGTLKPLTVDKIVIHWGGNTDPDGPDDVASEADEIAILRGWQRYHIDGRGWTDVAYGYGVGNSGLRYRMRGLNRQGATSGDFDDDGILENYEALSFVWIGGTAGTPTDEAYASMAALVLDAFETFGPMQVTGHIDHKATACPGPDWIAWIAREGWNDYTEGGVMEGHDGMDEMRDTHDAGTIPEWSNWEEYVDAGGSSVPESGSWMAWRFDLSVLWYRMIRPIGIAVAALTGRLEDLEAAVQAIEERPPGSGGAPTEPFEATITPKEAP